jgi:LysR family transcriptional regulator, hydrogen peroxide-inducible genes activator
MVASLAALRYAVAAARAGSFSEAARGCGVAQPTISNAISTLEEDLGARLFVRGGRGLQLTPAGERLLPLIEAVTAACTDLERGAAALVEPARRVLRLGFSPLLGPRLGILMQPFAREHPDVDIIYKECAMGDIEARLDNNSIDIAFGTGLRRGKMRGRQALYRDRLRYLAPGAAMRRTAVSLEDIARARLVLTAGMCGLATATRALFERRRMVLDEYAGQAMTYTVLQEWADLGIGGAIVPETLVRGPREVHPLIVVDGRPAALLYEAVWRKDMLVARHVTQAVRYLRTVVPGLAKGLAA